MPSCATKMGMKGAQCAITGRFIKGLKMVRRDAVSASLLFI